MAKRKRIHNVENIIKIGYGSGICQEYKHWISIQDCSNGRATRVKGFKLIGSMNFYLIWKEIIFIF